MKSRPVVLLVDDDPEMRDLLSTIFTLSGGFRIGGSAQDGFEGAMLAADLNPDVVILDYFMPRWDGERCANFIHERCPNSKILAFSAVLADAPEWADTFLLKSDIDRLVPVVQELLDDSEPPS
jgi:chemotaxis response regulator CheB